MRYYIIAGERSGDLHGGNLVKAIQNYDDDAVIRGFGGEYMQAAGVELAVHYSELAIMGLVELIANLNKISSYIRRCKEDIRSFKPDVIILIDYGGFNGKMAAFGRREGYKVFYYIPPKVWAWYQRRAMKLKTNVDRLFVILPFEKEFFKKFDVEADYVGNPVLDAVRDHQPDSEFLTRNGFDSKPIVALLPGSRKQELERITPVLTELIRANPQYQFAVATVDNLAPELYTPLRALPSVKLIHNATYDLLKHARAAVVTSGTATLETALFRVPQVVVYRTSPVSYFLVKRLITVPFISLVNLIAEREVVKELIQHRAKVDIIASELRLLVEDDSVRGRMLKGYDDVLERLDTGHSASDNAARHMVQYLK